MPCGLESFLCSHCFQNRCLFKIGSAYDEICKIATRIYFHINGLVYLFIDAFCHKSKTRCTCFTGHDISAQLSASLLHLDLEPANILVRNVHWDDIYRTFGHAVQGCRQRERGLKPPQILSSSYYVYK